MNKVEGIVGVACIIATGLITGVAIGMTINTQRLRREVRELQAYIETTRACTTTQQNIITNKNGEQFILRF